MAAHHFQHHDAVVAFGRGVQAVQGIGGAGHRRVEAERHDGCFQIVVNSLWHADDRHTMLKELLGDAERAIAAHAYQRAQPQPLNVRLCFSQDLLGNTVGFAVAGLGGKPAPVRRAEYGPADEQQRVHLLVIQLPVAQRFKQSLIAVQKADGVPAALGGAFDHGPNNRIEAGTIAPASQNADAFAHGQSCNKGAVPSPIARLSTD